MTITFTKNKYLHLGASAFIVILVGLAYGVNPSCVLPKLFDFKVESTDLSNSFRSIMGLYFGMAAYWIIGIIKHKAWKGATLSNILFMGGLVFGRIISMVIDGIPSNTYLFGLIAEVFAMIWGIYNLGYFLFNKNQHLFWTRDIK